MKKWLHAAVGLTTAAFLSTAGLPAFAAPDEDSAASEEGAVTVSINAISDFHGAIKTAPVLAKVLDDLKAENSNMHFVSVGDNIGGSTFESAVDNDEPTLAVLNKMGLMVSAVGNHEFDKGYADLRDRVLKSAKFTYLGANVKGAKEISEPPYKIFDVEGKKIAYVGAVTGTVPAVTAPSSIKGLSFNDPIDTVNTIAAQLKDGDESNGEADVVVALIHEGSQTVAKLGKNVDLAFGGHTHLDGETKTASGAPVCQPADHGVTLSEATVTIDGDTITADCKNVKMPKQDKENSQPVNADVQKLVDEYVKAADEKGSEQLFKIDGVANRGTDKRAGDEGANRGTESSAGNLIAQAFYEYFQNTATKADFGIMNSGGIRADFDPNKDGVVTLTESLTVQPFLNSLGTRVIKGADVYKLLEQQWKRQDHEEGDRPVLRLGLSNNVKYVYDPAAKYGEHILAVYLNGKLLDRNDQSDLVVASSSFLLDGGDTFSAMNNAGSQKVDTGYIDYEAFNQVAKGWEQRDGAVKVDYTQRSFGYTGPRELKAGEEVTIKLSSLAMTSTEPTPATVKLLLNGVEVGSSKVDTTVVPQLDETGQATITFTVPEAVKGDAKNAVLTIETSEPVSRIDVPVTYIGKTAVSDKNPGSAQNGQGAQAGGQPAAPEQKPAASQQTQDADKTVKRTQTAYTGASVLGVAALAAILATMGVPLARKRY